MRFFEILPVIVTLVVLFAPYKRGSTIGRILAAVLAITLLLHYVIEGSRWQMLPAYLVAWPAVVYAATDFSLQNRLLSRMGRGVGASMLLIGLSLAALFPIVNAGELAGEYAIGTVVYHVIDGSREEIYSAEPGDKRNLMLQVWYPATVADEPVYPYIPDIDVGGPALAGLFGLPSFLLNHTRLIETRSHVSAPPVAEGTPFPLLLFSHGLSGVRGQNLQQVEMLVSQGYVVAAVDHTYAAGYTVFTGNQVVPYDPGVIQFDTPIENATAQQLVSVWAADMSFVVDYLTQITGQPDQLLYNVVNFDQIGAFGQSTGGGASYEFCFRDPRCDAALGLDPWVIPTSDEAVSSGLVKPTMAIRAPASLSPENWLRLDTLQSNSSSEDYHLVVADTQHYDFTDFKRLSPALSWVSLTGGIDGLRIRDIMDSYSLAFFDYHVRGWAGALLFADSAEFPEVTLTRP